MNAPRTCRLVTLGCKVNQYETQYVKETLEANGYIEAAEGQPADLCVVNTCTVTAEGDAKSRQLIRRLHQHNPAAAIVVMGCYATRDPDAAGRHLALRRPPARLRQGAGRLPAALLLLHHPAGPAGRPQPARRRGHCGG